MTMLLATPYRDFNETTSSINKRPRVVSGIKKTLYEGCDPLEAISRLKPKLTGDLLVKVDGVDSKWWPRKSCIRNGQLLISGSGGCTPFRVPLRHLSLQAGPLPNSLSLCRGIKNAVVTLQTSSEETFDVWVKTIAIELIRQTPLDAIKYLDIFLFANYWKQKRDCNYTNKSCNVNLIQNEEKTVELILEKCQNTENYVPVREKLILFESLSRLGRKVRSSENVSLSHQGKPPEVTKRTRSMHDLTNLKTQKAVREICKYFEIQNELNSSRTSIKIK